MPPVPRRRTRLVEFRWLVVWFAIGTALVSLIGLRSWGAEESPSFAVAPIVVAQVDVLAFAERFGLFGALVGFFVWVSWLREKRLVDRVNLLEDYIVKHLSNLDRRSIEAINDNTTAIASLMELMEGNACLLNNVSELHQIAEAVRKVKRDRAEQASPNSQQTTGIV